MACKFCDDVLKNGKDMIARMKYSTAILDENQLYRGKSIIILNGHEENFLNLKLDESIGFYNEMRNIAAAIEKVTNPKRMNYALLGNVVHHLHWHIIPRYEEDENYNGPPNFKEKLKLSEGEMLKLKEKIRNTIHDINGVTYYGS